MEFHFSMSSRSEGRGRGDKANLFRVRGEVMNCPVPFR